MDGSYLNIENIEALIGQSDDKYDAFSLFNNNIDLLKNHTFIFLDSNMSFNTGNKIPEYMNKIEDGICATTLANENGCFILNNEIVLETLRNGTANFIYSFGYRLDVQMMNYLSDYYYDKKDIPQHFISILKRCAEDKIALDCTPYLFENGVKIFDPKIENGMCASFLPFVRFCESGFKKFSDDYPFLEPEYLKLNEIIGLMKNQYNNANNELVISQKNIYAILLKTTIISFESKSKIKKKFEELLDFTNNKLGMFFERELVICYWFLKDRNDDKICRFFKDIQLSTRKDIFNTLRGMAWDLLHLRWLMTSMFIGENNEQHNPSNCTIYIDSLVTQDRGLTNIIKAYPIKCIIYKSGDIMPKVIWKYSLTDIVDEIDVFNNFCSNIETRQKTLKSANVDILIQELENNLKQLLTE